MQTEDRQFKSPPAAGDPLKLPAAMEQDFSLPENADWKQKNILRYR